MGSESSKSINNEVFRVLAKILSTQVYMIFCFNTSVNFNVNGLLTFCKNSMFVENLVLELWSKNLEANQNAGFFELEYLINKLSYEVEFLDVTRVHNATNIV